MVRSVTEMLKVRRRGQSFDGLVCRDRLDNTGDDTTRSVIVERTDGPASQAGLKSGDVIVQVGDVKVACSYDIERAFLDKRPGESVAILVRRQAQQQRLDLVLASPDRTVRAASSDDVVWNKLGLQLSPAPTEQITRLHRQLHGGLEVLSVQADGPAGKAGIKKGDILIGLHQWETLSLDNVTYVLGHPDLASFQPLSFYILRSGQVRRGVLGSIE
jgi:serine protease Do